MLILTRRCFLLHLSRLLYGVLAAVVIWVLILEGRSKPENLTALPGLFIMLLITLFFSSRPARINWHTIYWSIGLQFILAYVVLKWTTGREAILWTQARLDEFFKHAEAGSKLLFGDSYKDHYMVFGVSHIILAFLDESMLFLAPFIAIWCLDLVYVLYITQR